MQYEPLIPLKPLNAPYAAAHLDDEPTHLEFSASEINEKSLAAAAGLEVVDDLAEFCWADALQRFEFHEDVEAKEIHAVRHVEWSAFEPHGQNVFALGGYRPLGQDASKGGLVDGLQETRAKHVVHVQGRANDRARDWVVDNIVVGQWYQLRTCNGTRAKTERIFLGNTGVGQWYQWCQWLNRGFSGHNDMTPWRGIDSPDGAENLVHLLASDDAVFLMRVSKDKTISGGANCFHAASNSCRLRFVNQPLFMVIRRPS